MNSRKLGKLKGHDLWSKKMPPEPSTQELLRSREEKKASRREEKQRNRQIVQTNPEVNDL
jgi:hypothetical protein